MFGRRRKWNAQVSERLRELDLSIEELGVMPLAEALDLVYPKGFTPEEAALYLGFLAYQTYLSRGDAKAHRIKWRLFDTGKAWIDAKKAAPKLIEAYWEKSKVWEHEVSRAPDEDIYRS